MEFLYSVNHQTRSFLEYNFKNIEREFDNEGLAVKRIEIGEKSNIYATLKNLD